MDRICIVVRHDLDAGRALNACGHLALGLGATIDPTSAAVRDFRCVGSDLPVSTLTDHPLVILRGSDLNDLKALVAVSLAREDMVCRVFYDVFFQGTVDDQIAALRDKAPTELGVAAVALCGTKAVISKLTKGAVLFR